MGATVRPSFEWVVDLAPTVLLDRVSTRLHTPGCPVSGLVAPGRIELHVHGRDEHFWSPQLIADVEATDSGSLLLARFGPHPSVWTLYLAGYALSCLIGMMSGVFAMAQYLLGQSPGALWGVLLAIVLSAALYLAALFGQGLSKEQMELLEVFLRQTVDSRFPQPKRVA